MDSELSPSSTNTDGMDGLNQCRYRIDAIIAVDETSDRFTVYIKK